MTKWFEKLRNRPQMRHLVAQSRDVAGHCQAETWDRVRGQIFEMALPEARGYVRVRCALVVRCHLMQHDASPRLQPSSHELLAALTTERLVHLVMTELLNAGSTARRAAA